MIDARAAMVATTPMVRATLALVLVASVDAHGAVTIPPPRQALDADLAPWSGAVPSPIPFGEGSDGSQFWCASPSASAAGGPSALNLTGQSGQACYWFSVSDEQQLLEVAPARSLLTTPISRAVSPLRHAERLPDTLRQLRRQHARARAKVHLRGRRAARGLGRVGCAWAGAGPAVPAAQPLRQLHAGLSRRLWSNHLPVSQAQGDHLRAGSANHQHQCAVREQQRLLLLQPVASPRLRPGA